MKCENSCSANAVVLCVQTDRQANSRFSQFREAAKKYFSLAFKQICCVRGNTHKSATLLAIDYNGRVLAFSVASPV